MQIIKQVAAVFCFSAVALLTAWPMSGALAAVPQFTVEPGQRQLFLDDFGVEKIENLTRTLHQPAKKGAVVRPTSPSEIVLQIRCAPAWDPVAKLWKIWIINSGDYSGTAYAQSTDGLHWTKPSLGQVEVNGSRKNNYITIDESLGWPANAIMNVVIDPDDPDPSRRFKGLGHAFNREPVVSGDGINWKKLDVPSIKSSDESNLTYDRLTRTFLATVKTGGRFGRAHALTTSKDFETWTEPKLMFEADELDQKLGRERIKARMADPTRKRPEFDIPETYGVDVYNFGLFRYETLYIGMPAMFYKTGRVSKDWPGFDELDLPEKVLTEVRKYGDWTGFHRVQLACSRDLQAWHRVADRRPFIDNSPLAGGSYDLQVVMPPSQAIHRGDELWFYYTGIQSYAYIGEATPYHGGAICLAVLRRDGFVSLDGSKEEGSILTKPFKLTGGKLLVNVDALWGELGVEALDENAKVIARSTPLSGDQPGGLVQWAEGNLADIKGQTVSLRFTLRNGELYSYWVETVSTATGSFNGFSNYE